MATSATYGFGRSVDWRAAVDEALERCGPLPDTPDLALVYITDYLSDDADHIRAAVVERTGVRALSGTVGVGVCCTRQEFMNEAALVLLFVWGLDGGVRSVSLEAGEALEDTDGTQVAIVHCDPGVGQRVLDAHGALGRSFRVGGMTSSRMRSAQLHTDGTASAGATALLLDMDVGVTCGLSQGCGAIGPVHQVTESVDQLVVRIDDRPALEVLLDEVGHDVADDMQQLAGHIFVAAQLPQRDTFDYVVRPLVGYDDDHGVLAVAHRFRAGDSLQFTRRDAPSARTDLQRMARSLRERVPAPPSAGVFFSCAARGSNLFDAPSVELDVIANELGDFPLVGFYGSGEISNDQIYGYTGVLLLFQ